MKTVIVSYLNTLPLRIALSDFKYPGFSLLSLPPNVCNEYLLNGKAELGLAPIITLLQNRNLKRIGSIGICSKNYVHSVGIFSNVPVHHLKKIYLDTESKTSVLLVKWLCLSYWNIHPEFVDFKAPQTTRNEPLENGYLLIGDKALMNQGKWKHYTDLAEGWNQATGLPFVFAAWIGISNKIPGNFICPFNRCQTERLQNLSSLVHHPEILKFGKASAMHYLQEYISYSIGPEEEKAIELFLKEIRKHLF